jgi:hypothetical protein
MEVNIALDPVNDGATIININVEKKNEGALIIGTNGERKRASLAETVEILTKIQDMSSKIISKKKSFPRHSMRFLRKFWKKHTLARLRLHCSLSVITMWWSTIRRSSGMDKDTELSLIQMFLSLFRNTCVGMVSTSQEYSQLIHLH